MGRRKACAWRGSRCAVAPPRSPPPRSTQSIGAPPCVRGAGGPGTPARSLAFADPSCHEKRSVA